MKKNKFILLLVAIFAVVFGLTVVYAIKSNLFLNKEEFQNKENEKLKVKGIEIKESFLTEEQSKLNESMFKNGEVIFKNNSNVTKFVDPLTKERKLELEKENAKIIKNEVIKYGDYVRNYGNNGALTEIDSERMVRVVQIYYPNGFDTLRGGFYKEATITGLYDAETGYYFGFIASGTKVFDKNDIRTKRYNE